MTALFLRAKHWQIFLFFFLLFFLTDKAAWIAVETMRYSRPDLSPITLLVVTLPTLCYVLWFWVLGSFLHGVLHPDLKPGIRLFRVAVLYTAICATPIALQIRPLGALFLLGVFDILFFLFSTYFVSKCLAMAETTRPVTFQDFWGTFLLFVFVPIGIWFLQPRINKLYEAAVEAQPDSAG